MQLAVSVRRCLKSLHSPHTLQLHVTVMVAKNAMQCSKQDTQFALRLDISTDAAACCGAGDPHSKAAAEALEQQNRISADNVGHRLLSKMGWKEGEVRPLTCRQMWRPMFLWMRLLHAGRCGAQCVCGCAC